VRARNAIAQGSRRFYGKRGVMSNKLQALKEFISIVLGILALVGLLGVLTHACSAETSCEMSCKNQSLSFASYDGKSGLCLCNTADLPPTCGSIVAQDKKVERCRP
jgi:hypothetical protein